MLPRHTGLACQAKYRLVKNREARIHPQSLGDTRASGEHGHDDEVEMLEKHTDAGHGHEKDDDATDAIPADLNGVPTASVDIEGLDKQDNEGDSMSAGSGGDPEAEEDDGGDTAHEPTVNDKE